jgi:thymidylate synthase (FAD)
VSVKLVSVTEPVIDGIHSAEELITYCARMVLPLNTSTTVYMNGTVRSWLHYLEIRCKNDTQKEHRVIADEIKTIFRQTFPNISEAMGW